MRFLPVIISIAASFSAMMAGRAETVLMGALDLNKMSQGWKTPRLDRSVLGNPLSIGGQKFDHGVGTHAVSTFIIDLKSSGERFTASVGVDDEPTGHPEGGTVEFRVMGDGRVLWSSDLMRVGDPPKAVDVSLAGIKVLTLLVTDGGDGNIGDHADWADAQLQFDKTMPEAVGQGTAAATPTPARKPKKAPHPAAESVLTGSNGVFPLASLDLTKMVQGTLTPQVNKSVRGRPLSIGGHKFSEGVGTHAESILTVDLKKAGRRFTASVGIDDDSKGTPGSVEFEVLGDGQVLWSSGLIKADEPPRTVDVDLSGISIMTLLVSDGGDGTVSDHADWADAKIETDGERPEAIEIAKP